MSGGGHTLGFMASKSAEQTRPVFGQKIELKCVKCGFPVRSTERYTLTPDGYICKALLACKLRSDFQAATVAAK